MITQRPADWFTKTEVLYGIGHRLLHLQALSLHTMDLNDES